MVLEDIFVIRKKEHGPSVLMQSKEDIVRSNIIRPLGLASGLASVQ